MVLQRGADGKVEIPAIILIKAKTDSLPESPADEASAQAAAVVAQAAAANVELLNLAERFVFPEKTNEFCTLTAGDSANTFGAAVEIVDNNGVKLSSKFAVSPGYLTNIILYTFSVADEMYLVEVSYGAGIIIGRTRVRSDWVYNLEVHPRQIPLGSTISYRMMAETALATCRVDFRYILG